MEGMAAPRRFRQASGGPYMTPGERERMSLGTSILILIGLAFMAWMALQDPLLHDEDDCAAMKRAADCWKDFDGR